MTTGLVEQAPEYLTTGAVAARYGVTMEAVRRWQTEGVCAPGGGRVYLRSIKIGGYRRTTWAWVEEFRLACEGQSEPVSAASPAKVDKEARAAQERLAERLKPRKRR